MEKLYFKPYNLKLISYKNIKSTNKPGDFDLLRYQPKTEKILKRKKKIEVQVQDYHEKIYFLSFAVYEQ